jgi:hypothetical protein
LFTASQKIDSSNYQKFFKTRLLGHYKELATDNADNCWLACDDELACNAITFYGSGFLNSNKNCFFYTSKEPARKADADFTSIIRRKTGIVKMLTKFLNNSYFF